MKAPFTLTAIAAIFAASAHAAQVGGSVNVQNAPQGSTVVIQGGATIPVGKAATLTPQVQVVVPPPAQSPPMVSGGIQATIPLSKAVILTPQVQVIAPPGMPPVVSGGIQATVPLGKAVIVTPQFNVIAPPGMPPVVSGGFNFNVR